MTRKFIILAGFALIFVLTGCNLDQARPISKLKTFESLVVAWVDRGNLVVWRTGDDNPRRIASGGVIRPYVSPDGQSIAFTRGPNGRAETLWLADITGTTEILLVGEGNPRVFRSGMSQVGDVGWYDETTLYINTIGGSGIDTKPRDDLYRVNARTREVSLILRPGDGGRFAFSPDKKFIAVASAGTYGRQDARVAVVDPLAIDGATNLIFYIGVATGSEAIFRVNPQWTPDSQSVLTAIPESDLIYSETGDPAPTSLWQLPIDTPSDRNLLGSVRSSFFGLPRWSDDREKMLYLRRTPESNEFTIVIADANGDNPVDYATGDAGVIELPRWIPDTQKFFYTSENPGNVLVGQVGEEAEALSDEVVYNPLFVRDDLYVFVTSPAVAADGFQMQYARIGHSSINIGGAGGTVPLFDAVLVERTET